MIVCYMCETEISKENHSDEHIILNALGGRLKSKKLLCKKCNSIYGSDYDAELAKSTNTLANLLMIKREDGQSQPIKGKLSSTQESYSILPDGSPRAGKPKFIKEIDGEKIKYSISARDESELTTILKGLQKKHPELNITDAIANSTHKNVYLNEPIQFDVAIGGLKVFKAVTKSAVNFYIHNGGDRNEIKHVIQYLRDEADLDVAWLHYPNTSPYIAGDEEVSHLVYIYGSASDKILYAYIEFFNTDCYIVKLNDDYKGNNINAVYVQNLIDNTNTTDVFIPNYSREEILNFFENKNYKPFTEVQKRYDRTMNIAYKRQTSNHTYKLMSEGLQNALGKYPEGTKITEEMIGEAVEETMKLLEPWIIRNMKRSENLEDKEE